MELIERNRLCWFVHIQRVCESTLQRKELSRKEHEKNGKGEDQHRDRRITGMRGVDRRVKEWIGVMKGKIL